MFWYFVYLWRTLNVICYSRWVLRVAKNFDDSYLYFWLLFFHLASFFIFRYQLRSSCFCTVVAAVSSVIDRFLSVSPSANLMFFETLNVLDRGWLTYSGGTNRSCELERSLTNSFWDCSLFSKVPDCNVHSLVLLDFLSSGHIFCIMFLSLHIFLIAQRSMVIEMVLWSCQNDWILWVGFGCNWCIYPLVFVWGQASFNFP